MYVKVAIDLALDRLFTYEVPVDLCSEIKVGQLLRVPFGHREARGFALDVQDAAPASGDYKIKPILGIADKAPFFSPEMLKLVRWIAEYTCSPIELCLKAAVPAAVLKPNAKPEKAATLPLVAGIAVAAALEKFLPSAEIAVKWPNDILCGGRKICGILCEMAAQGDSVRHVIAGIGINVNLPANELPAEIAETATSMRILSGKEFSPGEILNAVLDSFARCYARWQEAGLDAVKDELDTRDALRGRRVEMRLLGKPLFGTAVGIAESGALLLRLDDGSTEEVFSGEAHIVR